MLEVTILRAGSLTEAEIESLWRGASPARRARAVRCRTAEDARNCLLGEALTCAELSRVFSQTVTWRDISVDSKGKPFLPAHASWCFNISHSGSFVACAVADRPVGIDVERIRPVSKRLAERFFTPLEALYVNESLRNFFTVWTRKESRIKCEGGGLSVPLASFCVLEDGIRDGFYYTCVWDRQDAMCHVCTKTEETPRVRVTGSFL